jgi:hypothetical protein
MSIDASPAAEVAPVRALCVLGMHRSGTSALTRVLNLAGAELGSALLPAMPGVNDGGFWEHAHVVRLHEQLLERLNSSWHDVAPLPHEWWQREGVIPIKQQLCELLRREFSEAPLWAVKDPRLCRLLPMWIDIFAELGWTPGFILAVRNPQEVAASLARRDWFPQSKSLLLWMSHVLEAVEWTRPFPRVVVTYDELLDDWQGTLRHIAHGLRLTWPRDLDRIAEEVNAFLSPQLRHHRAASAAPELLAPSRSVRRIWRSLREARSQGVSHLDREVAPLRTHVRRASLALKPWIDGWMDESLQLRRAEDGLRSEITRLCERSAELDRQLAAARDAQVNVLPEFEHALKQLRGESEDRLRELVHANARAQAQIAQLQEEVARYSGQSALMADQLARRDRYYSQLRFRLAERSNLALRMLPPVHRLLKGLASAAARVVHGLRAPREIVR